MGEFTAEHLGKIQSAIALFNAQKYWECHEHLERHWLEEPGPVRNVYWALIQIAAALIHYREGNLAGAKGMLIKAKEKLHNCERLHLECPLLEKRLSWSSLKSTVNFVPINPQLHDFDDLFNFRFKDPSTWT